MFHKNILVFLVQQEQEQLDTEGEDVHTQGKSRAQLRTHADTNKEHGPRLRRCQVTFFPTSNDVLKQVSNMKLNGRKQVRNEGQKIELHHNLIFFEKHLYEMKLNEIFFVIFWKKTPSNIQLIKFLAREGAQVSPPGTVSSFKAC